VATLEYEDLTDVVLLAHSYGGMVATGVANRLPDRIAQLVYLDAFVPKDGQSMIDLLPPSAAEETRQRALETGDGWRLPPNPLAPDTPGELREWMTKRRMPQTLLTQSQPITLRPGVAVPRHSYIYCMRIGPCDIFGSFAAQAKADPAWRYFEIDSTHGPHITAPDQLVELVDRIAKGA
jgi:pimeloyl-ACP methyl ester carboxylesterase